MKTAKSSNIDETMQEKIISAAYGSASILERIKVFFLIRKNAEAKRLFEEYKQTADEVHSAAPDELPADVLQKVKTEIHENIKVKEEQSFLSDLASIIFFKPQVSFTAAIVLVIAITFSIATQSSRPERQYSQVEVENATRQTKQALALVSDILLDAKTTITKDIIPNRVVKPVNESFNYVNNFIKGEKNETVN